MLRMGFGSVDTTPAPGLRIAGGPPWPRAEGVRGPLRGRVALADDGNQRVAIVSLDLMALLADEANRIREHLGVVGELSPDAIMLACSHTHAAPFTFIDPVGVEAEVTGYLDELTSVLESAMSLAATDLQPIQLKGGIKPCPGWAFNRRTIFSGDQVATHGSTWEPGFTGMEGEPDDDVQVLVARSAGGDVAGGVVNFSCHPTLLEGRPLYSSDYPGVLSSDLESRHGGVFGFLQGASADTANLDPSDRNPARWFGWEHALAMGRALADTAGQIVDANAAMAGDHVRHGSTSLSISQRRPTQQQLELARWYRDEAPPDIDERAFTKEFTGHDHIFGDVPPRMNERFVNELLAMWEWQRQAATRDIVENVEVQVIVIGECAIVGLPVEFFTSLGRRIKSDSPFGQTFVSTLTNGWHGYAPTIDAFERGGYEAVFAVQSRLAPEAGERMVQAALDLLHRLRV